MSLIINIRKLDTASESMEHQTSVDVTSWLKDRSDIRSIDSMKVNVQAKAFDNGMLVKGEAHVLLEFTCSKCIVPFQDELRLVFTERFTRMANEADEEADIHILHGDEVDMLPYVEEHFQLALPYVCICKEDCKGLCPNCGTNRNEHTCSCTNEKIDPRLAKLKDFYDKILE